MDRNKKIVTVLMVFFCILTINYISFAAEPDVISKDYLTSAMKQAEKPVDGTIVRIDVPGDNGNYITLEGAGAQKWWDEAVLETKKSLAEDMSVLKGKSSTMDEGTKPPDQVSYKYRYQESKHTNNVKRTDLRRKVADNVVFKETYDLRLDVAQSWSINPEISGKYKKAVTSKLGGSWGKSYSKDQNLHAKIAPRKGVQVQFVPIMDKSTGKVQKYYIPREGVSKKPIIEKSMAVTTYNPKYTDCKVGPFKLESVYGAYIWVEK